MKFNPKQIKLPREVVEQIESKQSIPIVQNLTLRELDKSKAMTYEVDKETDIEEIPLPFLFNENTERFDGIYDQETAIRHFRNTSKLYKRQRNQFHRERNSLINDLEVQHKKNMQLEQVNDKQLELLKKFSGFINFKLWVSPANETYKHYRHELDKLGVK